MQPSASTGLGFRRELRDCRAPFSVAKSRGLKNKKRGFPLPRSRTLRRVRFFGGSGTQGSVNDLMFVIVVGRRVFPRQLIKRWLVPSGLITILWYVEFFALVILDVDTMLSSRAVPFSIDAARFHKRTIRLGSHKVTSSAPRRKSLRKNRFACIRTAA